LQGKEKTNSLNFILNLEEEEKGVAEIALTHKLVQCKTQEEDSTMAYGEKVMDMNKLTSVSYVFNDGETISVPKHKKR
jgi:hypothetical protein